MKILLLLMLSGTAFGQSWYKVAMENQSVTVPANTVVRYGSVTSWDPNKSFLVQTSFVAGNTYFGNDPDVGVVKELDVLQTTSPQVVTVAGVSVTVPAVAAPPPAASGTAAYCSTGLAKTYTITTSATYNATGFLTSGTAVMTCN